MQLTQNFTLKELTHSDTANRLDIDNTPSDSQIKKLEALTINVLQPLRDHFGPVQVNSGFRCAELNSAIRGARTSQHMQGEAADVEIRGHSNKDVAIWIRDNLEFDKVILEFYSPTDPSAGWVHVSFQKDNNRGASYRIQKGGTYNGLE